MFQPVELDDVLGDASVTFNNELAPLNGGRAYRVLPVHVCGGVVGWCDGAG